MNQPKRSEEEVRAGSTPKQQRQASEYAWTYLDTHLSEMWEHPARERRSVTVAMNMVAAAPDLIAAIKILVPRNWRQGHMDHMPGVQLARTALARAEGRTP